jgi:5'-nucleotidase
MRLRRGIVTCLFVLLAAVVSSPIASARPAGAESSQAPKPKLIQVQLLAINDFHGNIQPPSGSSGRVLTPTGQVDAGGVEYLATHIAQLKATNPNTVVVAAGDLIGASPLVSALFHDEPTIEALSMAGLQIASVGNHEFDEGTAELLRMQNGGCHPTDGCQDGDPFEGASFRYLAANVVNERNGKTLFPAYEVKNFKGTKVAFIGMTLEGTPAIVTPSGIAGYDFLDEVETVNALVPRLKQRGIEAIVVLIHEGGFPTGLYDECPGISGPIVDIVQGFDDEVDVVVSGHTHQAYNCVIDGRIVTSASSFGRIVSDIDLTIDQKTRDVVSATAANVIATRTVAPDPAEAALVAKYATLSAPLANRVIGSVTADITRATNAAGSSPLGDVIADAQLAATTAAAEGGAVAAFMNPGGIRADLTFAQSGAEGDGNVTYAEAFTVQPFGNSLVTMTLTGAQIDTLLEQQFDNPAVGQNRILQVSDGFTYTWDASLPVGSRVDPATIEIAGVPVDPAGTYRVTVNSFLAEGGDGFAILRDGTDRLGGDVDLDALVDYFGASSPVAPGAADRITRLN